MSHRVGLPILFSLPLSPSSTVGRKKGERIKEASSTLYTAACYSYWI